MNYFGVNIKEDIGYKLNHNNFITKTMPNYKEDKKYISECYKNFDLNMKYYESLKEDEFVNSLNKFLLKYKQFKKLENLNECKYSGYYLMVLDEYKQIYIGTSSQIKTRVMKHWSTKFDFDRLIFGSVKDSKLSINSFRALDTTRLYVYKTDNIYSEENKFIKEIDNKFLCNRTEGGFLFGGFLEAISKGKFRKL